MKKKGYNCDLCKKYLAIYERKGVLICRTCKLAGYKDKCFICGKFKEIEIKDEDGNLICIECFKKIDKEIRKDLIEKLRLKKGIKTYTYIHKKEDCGICGENKPVEIRNKETGEAICSACYKYYFKKKP